MGLVLLGLGVPLRAQAPSSLPPAETYRLSGEYWSWNPTLTATLRSGTSGDLLDAKQDLGILDQSTSIFGGTLQLAPGFKINGDYTKLAYSGDNAAQRSFVFGGTTYPVTARVFTQLTGGYVGGSLEWDFIKSSSGFLGGFVGAKYIHVSASLSAPDAGVSAADTLRVVVPVLGVSARYYLSPRLSIGGQFSGFTIGAKGELYELQATGLIHLSSHLAAGGGYRLLQIKGSDTSRNLDVKLEGWEFGGSIRF